MTGESGDCLTTLKILHRNPQLLKVLLASGFSSAASSVSVCFVTTALKNRIWHGEQSEIQARYAMAMSIVGIVGGSLYGRFSDNIDRRLAAGLYGLLNFLPSWTFLFMGLTGTALMVSCILQVVSLVGVASNVMLVLAQDVAAPEEQEVAFGSFYLLTSFMSLLFMGIPTLLILTLQVVDANPYFCLWYQVGLSIGFFLCIASVRMPPRPREERSVRKAALTPREILCMPFANLVAPLRLGCGDARIRAACWAAFLIAFSGDLTLDVGGQYFQDCLGLLPPEGSHLRNQVETAEFHRHLMGFGVLTSLPPQFAALPGYALVGWGMKRLGSKRLLQLLVPVSALMTGTGACFQFVANSFTLSVQVILLTYASMANVPVLAWVKEVAPPDRVGEAIGAVGSCSQAANFLGNLVVSFLNPVVLRLLGSRGFWVYYPASGLLTLLALLPVQLLREDPHATSKTQEVENNSSDTNPEETIESSGDTWDTGDSEGGA